ncbi:MAG: DUF2975 domain-containing protein [Verrucomicrobiota bacterium]
MLWEPHIEGRNAHATTFEIYFNDPFLAYAYVGSIPFFVALYRSFRLFGHVRQSGAFSQGSVDDLRVIRRCAGGAHLLTGVIVYQGGRRISLISSPCYSIPIRRRVVVRSTII